MNKMLLFYLPLALPAALMGMSQSIISGALARMDDAAVILASYILAGGITLVGESVVFPARQLTLALVRDRHSWRITRTVVWTVGLTSLAIQLIVGWGPLMRPVFQTIFGVPESLLAPTVTAFRFFMWITVISAWRFLHQGVAVGHKQPLYVTAGVVLRLPFMLALAWGLVNHGWLPPVFAGPAIIMLATVVEAVVAYIGSRRILNSLPEHEDAPPLTLGAGFRFYLPLVLSMLAWAGGRPLVNAAIGRSVHAEDALAALALSVILTFSIMGPLSMLHQVTAVFGQTAAGRIASFRFAAITGLLATLLVAVLGFTAAGSSFLIRVLAVPAHLEDVFLSAIRPMVVWPLLVALSDHAQGILLTERRTRLISVAKLSGVAVSIGVAWLLVGSTPTPAAAAALAIWAMAAAAATEALIFYGRPLFTQLRRAAYRG